MHEAKGAVSNGWLALRWSAHMCLDGVLADLQVEVSKLDVADMEEAKGVVALAQKQAPIGGIFHLAMILQDRWMANQVSILFLAAVHAKHY